MPEDTGENLDSFVRTNAFWCYLDSEDTGLFKMILYKKTVDNKVKPLGNEKNPEKATKNSLRAYGDYVYYLPKVAENRKSSLSEEEKEGINNFLHISIDWTEYSNFSYTGIRKAKKC